MEKERHCTAAMTAKFRDVNGSQQSRTSAFSLPMQAQSKHETKPFMPHTSFIVTRFGRLATTSACIIRR